MISIAIVAEAYNSIRSISNNININISIPISEGREGFGPGCIGIYPVSIYGRYKIDRVSIQGRFRVDPVSIQARSGDDPGRSQLHPSWLRGFFYQRVSLKRSFSHRGYFHDPETIVACAQ
jgi:hypothetical protein